MIPFGAAAATARHHQRRGEYEKADAILMLIKANLSEWDARTLGALEGTTDSIDSCEVARRASLNPDYTKAALRRLLSYGLAARVGRRGARGMWQAVGFWTLGQGGI